MKSKLTLMHIHIIGIVSVLIITAILYFAMTKPKGEEIETVSTEAKGIEDNGGTEERVAEQQTKLKNTQKTAEDTRRKWAVNEDKYMNNPTDIQFGKTEELPMTYYTYIATLPQKFGTWVAAWYDSQRDRGVSRLPGVEFPIAAFSSDPNAIANIQDATTKRKSLRFPQQGAWPVDLECKTFDAAMEHLSKFNRMEKHGMPVIDGVALSGQSPNLIMSYNLTMYVIPKPDVPAPDVRITPGGAAAAGGMAPGGMGMMGMPPGGSMGSMGMGAPAGGSSGGAPAMSSMGGGRGRAAQSGDY